MTSTKFFALNLLVASAFIECAMEARSDEAEWGTLVEVALPIDEAAQRSVVAAVNSLDVAGGERRTIVLVFGQPGDAVTGRDTAFEPALGLARFLTGETATKVRSVAYLAGPVEGHAVLPVLACDRIIVSAGASLGSAGVDERSIDAVVRLAYDSITERRRTIPPAAVRAMLDANLELARISQVEGGDLFLAGEELRKHRDSGKVWKEEQLSPQGQLASFAGPQMRSFRWVTHEVSNSDELATALGLQGLRTDDGISDEERKAILAEIKGPINSRRMRRLGNNLADATSKRGFNHVIFLVDSAGGDFDEAIRTATMIAELPRQGVRTAAFIEGQALGDASLVALSSQKVFMSADAVLGGPGAAALNQDELRDLRETIDEIGRSTGRSPALLRGLLDGKLSVARYTDSRTGRRGYFTADELADREDAERWTRGKAVSLRQGLNADQALELGLISGIPRDLKSVSTELGLSDIPRRLEDRKLVHFVESLGRQIWLPRLLLFIGFCMLTVEMGAPGIGVPGFISLVSLLLFFWIQAAGGTAEWLEILLFAGGVACLLIEVFLFPGFGIFGVGGLVMLIASLVLVSQTFVVPHNEYQFAALTENLVGVLAALAGIFGGGIALRWMLPQIPFLSHLVMTEDEEERVVRAAQETIVNWNHLIGQQGATTTPLVPAGKARFGDQIVAVVSNGPMIDRGAAVVVREVHGNRVVVEAQS